MEKEVQDIPDTMPAPWQDCFNYITRYVTFTNYQIQAVLHFRGRLDAVRLARAVKLSVDAEPVLGCKFIEREDMPFWQLRTDLDSISWCGLEEVPDREKAAKRFLLKELDMDNDPQVLGRLFRSGKQDTLCIKLNHTSCDGGGAKAYLRLLADLYTELGRDPDYLPEPNVSGIRNQTPIFDALGIRNLESDPEKIGLGTAVPESSWAFPLQQPDKPYQYESAVVAINRISSQDFQSISAYARARGATINDMLLTAFFRALFDTLEPVSGIPKEINFTVDLRRHLPEGTGIAISNLSALESISTSRISDEPFSATLERVVSIMTGIKSQYLGVQGAIGCELPAGTRFADVLEMMKQIVQKTQEDRKCTPTLTNFGVISPNLLLFGETVAEDAYIVAPFFYAPGFMLGASTYNGVLTLTAGYYEPATKGDDVTLLLEMIADELISCCGL
ncbi:condensation domain-containing protein [Methanosarcina sp. Mfa9]|uniref:condensation domain-containing protein n=1 Tax=Methanosarcina sp. Mfa9 TaxID=3439063 RepID=UPI003F84F7A0